MDDEKKFFITSYLDKSKEALKDAQININNLRLVNAQNRIYYAIFYSVVTLGYLENFISSKHKQLMGWFNKKFIHKENIFELFLYDIYKEAYDNRHESDYTVFSNPNEDEVKLNYENAVIFIDKIYKYIMDKIKSLT